jgi:hypothetical protein
MDENEMLAEQLKHAMTLLRVEINALRVELEHQRQFSEHRLSQLERVRDDHEERLRGVGDGVTQFKVWAGLASGGSGLVSVAALIKAWFGG